jgi:hypothetical protein
MYDRVCRTGHSAARHLDFRLVPQLPDLVALPHDGLIKEVKSWDLAMLGIVLGFFKWPRDNHPATYMYNPEGKQAIEVGPNYIAIAEWLRSVPQIADGLRDRIDKWFTERAEAPSTFENAEEKLEAARKEARRLTLLGLVVDLLGQYCFKTIPARPMPLWPPAHTLTRRLRTRRVNRYLAILQRNYEGLDLKAIENELVHSAHRYVHFVGAPSANGSPAPFEGELERVLQLLPEGKENPDGGRAVLIEAFNNHWYDPARVLVASDAKSLFPTWGEHHDRDV